jgi:hypothetical protein
MIINIFLFVKIKGELNVQASWDVTLCSWACSSRHFDRLTPKVKAARFFDA